MPEIMKQGVEDKMLTTLRLFLQYFFFYSGLRASACFSSCIRKKELS